MDKDKRLCKKLIAEQNKEKELKRHIQQAKINIVNIEIEMYKMGQGLSIGMPVCCTIAYKSCYGIIVGFCYRSKNNIKPIVYKIDAKHNIVTDNRYETDDCFLVISLPPKECKKIKGLQEFQIRLSEGKVKTTPISTMMTQEQEFLTQKNG